MIHPDHCFRKCYLRVGFIIHHYLFSFIVIFLFFFFQKIKYFKAKNWLSTQWKNRISLWIRSSTHKYDCIHVIDYLTNWKCARDHAVSGETVIHQKWLISLEMFFFHSLVECHLRCSKSHFEWTILFSCWLCEKKRVFFLSLALSLSLNDMNHTIRWRQSCFARRFTSNDKERISSIKVDKVFVGNQTLKTIFRV